MSTIIDHLNLNDAELRNIVDNIQNRYLDPYTAVSLSEKGTYRFFDKEINKIIDSLYGDGTIIEGLKITKIDTSHSNYIDVYVISGKCVADKTIIEFTNDFIIRVPREYVDNTNSEYNIIGIDYINSETYPPNVAIPIVIKHSLANTKNISCVLGVFKLNGNTVTYLTPDNGIKKGKPEIKIGSKKFVVKPGRGKLSDIHETFDLIQETSNSMSRADFEAKAELVRRLCAGSGFVEWGNKRFYYNSGWYDINRGLSTLKTPVPSMPNYIAFWFKPIVNVNGYLIRLDRYQQPNDNNGIHFPEPPSSPDQLYRQDLVFLEVWHEDVSEKDVVFPYGNVQYGADKYTAPDGTVFHTTPITDLGIKQGYSSFGSWDKETVGKGIRWSSLTDEQKKAFMSDPWNNIYVDGDKVIQVRYRVRVVESVDDMLFYLESINGSSTNGKGLRFTDQQTAVVPCGAQEVTLDVSYTQAYFWFHSGYTKGELVIDNPGVYIAGSWSTGDGLPKDYSYNRRVYAIPIALVARRNIGAFHPVYNPNGSALFTGGKRFWEVTPTAPSFDIVGVDKDNKQFKVAGDKTNEIKPNYFIEVTGSTGNDGRYWVTKVEYSESEDKTIITVANDIPDTTADGKLTSDFGYVKYCFDHRDTNSGLIETGKSGRPDGKYADEINEGDVKDLRNYALRVTDYQRLLEKEFNKLLLGEMRGWETQFNSWYCYVGGKDDKYWMIYGLNKHKISATASKSTDIVIYNKKTKKIYKVDFFGFTGGSYIKILKTAASDFQVGDELVVSNEKSYFVDIGNQLFSRKLVVDTVTANNDALSEIFNHLGSCEYITTKGTVLNLNFHGDYNESFIPTDDFTATVDSSDTSVIKISGDKRYAIKKNCRLFVRNTSNVSIDVFRVKSVSFDGTNTIVRLTGSAGSGGSTVKVSTCIASGRNGTTSAGKQVYLFKLSRMTYGVLVLIRKKDGSWYAYNDFKAVNIHKTTNMQSFIDNIGGTGNEIVFNVYLNWIGINISDIYSALGYSSEDDFKQNAVIKVYYTTKANPLRLTSRNPILLTLGNVISSCYCTTFGGFLSMYTAGKVIECSGSLASNVVGKPYGFTLAFGKFDYNGGYNTIKYNDPFDTFNNKGGYIGGIWLPLLTYNNGKLILFIKYKEMVRDIDTGTIGDDRHFVLSSYESTRTDLNGNPIIEGQKEVELPYFVWNEDEE